MLDQINLDSTRVFVMVDVKQKRTIQTKVDLNQPRCRAVRTHCWAHLSAETERDVLFDTFPIQGKEDSLMKLIDAAPDYTAWTESRAERFAN